MFVPTPGTTGGPCVGDCRHSDCVTARADAAAICPRCDKPIGYDTHYWISHAEEVHDACIFVRKKKPR